MFSVLVVLAGRWGPAVLILSADRGIPRATMLGTIVTAVVSMLSPTAVFGIVPTPAVPPSPRAGGEPR